MRDKVSTDHNFSRERRTEADSNRGTSAYHPYALPLGQTRSRFYINSLETWVYFFVSESYIIRVQTCNLPPVFFLFFFGGGGGMTGIFYVLRGRWNGYRDKRAQKIDTGDSNPWPFSHESGTLTTKLTSQCTLCVFVESFEIRRFTNFHDYD